MTTPAMEAMRLRKMGRLIGHLRPDAEPEPAPYALSDYILGIETALELLEAVQAGCDPEDWSQLMKDCDEWCDIATAMLEQG